MTPPHTDNDSNYILTSSPTGFDYNNVGETASTLVCYRTQCALRILILPLRRWKHFISGLDPTDGEAEQREVDSLLYEALTPFREEANEAVLVKLNPRSDLGPEAFFGEGHEEARRALWARWKQINTTVEVASNALGIASALLGPRPTKEWTSVKE
jgi:hypothetical protein